VAQQTARLGSDLITIRPSQVSNSPAILGDFGQSNVGSLNPQDIKTVTNTPGVKTVVPLSIVAANIETNQNGRAFTVPIIGTTAGLPATLDQTVEFGTFLTGETGDDNKIILGANAAQTLFTQNDPLAQAVTILGQDFIVVGVLNNSQASPLTSDLD